MGPECAIASTLILSADALRLVHQLRQVFKPRPKAMTNQEYKNRQYSNWLEAMRQYNHTEANQNVITQSSSRLA